MQNAGRALARPARGQAALHRRPDAPAPDVVLRNNGSDLGIYRNILYNEASKLTKCVSKPGLN
jgi:hypothetical protein